MHKHWYRKCIAYRCHGSRARTVVKDRTIGRCIFDIHILAGVRNALVQDDKVGRRKRSRRCARRTNGVLLSALLGVSGRSVLGGNISNSVVEWITHDLFKSKTLQ